MNLNVKVVNRKLAEFLQTNLQLTTLNCFFVITALIQSEHQLMLLLELSHNSLLYP
jgi:hypothetical protein